MKHHHDFKDGAQFIPFGVEISEGLGPAAQRFFDGAQRWFRTTPRHEPLPLNGTIVPAFLDAAPWGRSL